MSLAHSLRSVAVAAVALFLVSDCVSARLIHDPTAPGPDWSVYSSATTGVAVALPKSWRVFDLGSDGAHAAAVAWAKADVRATSNLEPAVERLMRDCRARFFACDTDRAVGGPQAAAAYAIWLAAPAEGVDAFASSTPQVPGRRVVERRHVQGNAGDLLMQRIEQQGDIPITQYQFLIVTASKLHALFIELPQAAMAAGGAATAERIGQSFTPIGAP